MGSFNFTEINVFMSYVSGYPVAVNSRFSTNSILVCDFQSSRDGSGAFKQAGNGQRELRLAPFVTNLWRPDAAILAFFVFSSLHLTGRKRKNMKRRNAKTRDPYHENTKTRD